MVVGKTLGTKIDEKQAVPMRAIYLPRGPTNVCSSYIEQLRDGTEVRNKVFLV